MGRRALCPSRRPPLRSWPAVLACGPAGRDCLRASASAGPEGLAQLLPRTGRGHEAQSHRRPRSQQTGLPLKPPGPACTAGGGSLLPAFLARLGTEWFLAVPPRRSTKQALSNAVVLAASLGQWGHLRDGLGPRACQRPAGRVLSAVLRGCACPGSYE